MIFFAPRLPPRSQPHLHCLVSGIIVCAAGLAPLSFCFALQPGDSNVGESATSQYAKSAKEAVNFVARGAGYLANAAKQAVVGDGLARENHNPAGEVTATRRDLWSCIQASAPGSIPAKSQ